MTDLSDTTAAGAQQPRDPQMIAWPARTRARQRGVIEALPPHVIVLFGATGDLAKRKLLPGLGYLQQSRFTPDVRIVGTAMEDISTDEFRGLAKAAIDSFGTHKLSAEEWNDFSEKLTYVPHSAGPEGLTPAVKAAEAAEALLGEGVRRLHYLSVPPRAAQAVIAMLRDADLVDNARVIMEKPFGDDLETAIRLNDFVHQTFAESQIFRIDHFLGKEAAQNILAFRFANGLFEPIWNRNFIDHIQIDVPETLGLDQRADFYEATGAYKDMVVTHLHAGDGVRRDGAAHGAGAARDQRGEEQGLPLDAADPPDRCRARAVHGLPRREGRGAGLRHRDVHRAAGRPRQLAVGGHPVLPAHRQEDGRGDADHLDRLQGGARTMFPPGSGVGQAGPDHLTFDLADNSRVSLSFYGKRPGPGMRLEKLSMQFATGETERAGDVMEAYERLILDAMRGDHTLFTTAEGIESLWERSAPLLEDPPPVKVYPPGTWGPNAIHQLIAPNAWRLPFERAWREKR